MPREALAAKLAAYLRKRVPDRGYRASSQIRVQRCRAERVVYAAHMGKARAPQVDHVQVPKRWRSGPGFLDGVRGYEVACERQTRAFLASGAAGRKAPLAVERLGVALALLDRAASCFWGCRGGDHIVEYLAGRTTVQSEAALTLTRRGHYDDALALVRNLGETTNLLSLFSNDPSSFEMWKQLPGEQRWNKFRPAKVRRALAALNVTLPISSERYSALCELATHVTPEMRPGAHNSFSIPITAPMFQPQGLLLALNELAFAVAFAAIYVPHLAKLDRALVPHFYKAARALLEAYGGVNLTDGVWRTRSNEIGRLFKDMAMTPEERRLMGPFLFELSRCFDSAPKRSARRRTSASQT